MNNTVWCQSLLSPSLYLDLHVSPSGCRNPLPPAFFLQDFFLRSCISKLKDSQNFLTINSRWKKSIFINQFPRSPSLPLIYNQKLSLDVTSGFYSVPYLFVFAHHPTLSSLRIFSIASIPFIAHPGDFSLPGSNTTSWILDYLLSIQSPYSIDHSISLLNLPLNLPTQSLYVLSPSLDQITGKKISTVDCGTPASCVQNGWY